MLDQLPVYNEAQDLVGVVYFQDRQIDHIDVHDNSYLDTLIYFIDELTPEILAVSGQIH